MRPDLTLEMPPGRIASSTCSSGASRTACQVGRRARSRRYDRSRLRSFVDCERTVRMSSAIGWPCGRICGTPLTERRRSRIRSTRARAGGLKRSSGSRCARTPGRTPPTRRAVAAMRAAEALVGVERVRMVVHDWGAVGLAFAQRCPERVERLVVINAVPLLGGYRWHRIARIWRTPLLGELAMGATTRRALELTSREGNVTPGPMPRAWLDSVL